MFLGSAAVLILATGFVTEVPPVLKAHLASTNETCGVFVQTKTDPSGARFVSRGTYRIRPGVDFEWRTLEPFETCFTATPERYSYSNEDECVSHALRDLPFASRLPSAGAPDPKVFFRLFDALYKEESGRFFLKAKPKVADLKRVIDRVEAEGVPGTWTLRITFVTRAALKLDFRRAGPQGTQTATGEPLR